ncbi:N-acetylmuramoyl-L-alanine amidase [Thermocrispum agreste]
MAVGACSNAPETSPNGHADRPSSPPPASSRPAQSTRPVPPSAAPTQPPNSASATATTQAKKAVVVLDPGHNGGNAAAPEEINRHVPAGRGRTKPCNTTGTATNDGYPEHAFTFDVAKRVRRLLRQQGIEVVMTRQSDDGVGPCVDRRADIGNRTRADAVVSIHADGAEGTARGFHIAYSSPPLNAAQGKPSVRLARTLRDALRDAGFPLSTYLGSDGLAPRDDLAGLNLSKRPVVLVECGNMRNPQEAATMKQAAGRQKYADAIADGVLRYLGAR